MIDANGGHFRWLFNAQASLTSRGSRGRKTGAQGVSPCVDLDVFERSGIECQPQAERSDIDALTKCIERFDSNPIAIDFRISSEGLPAEFRMIHDVCPRVYRDAEKVRPVIAGIRIPSHILREGMKRRASKTLLIDIAQSAHRATVAGAQQMKIIGVVPERGQHRNGIEPGTVMVQLPFCSAAGRSAVKEIPEAAGVAVVAPVRDRRHI